jgi:hypothetical protein
LRGIWLAQAGNRISSLSNNDYMVPLLQQDNAFWINKRLEIYCQINRRCAIGASALTVQSVAGLRSHHVDGSAGMLLYTSPTLAAIQRKCCHHFIFLPTSWTALARTTKGKVKAKPRPCRATLVEYFDSKTICSLKTLKRYVEMPSPRPIQWLSKRPQTSPN